MTLPTSSPPKTAPTDILRHFPVDSPAAIVPLAGGLINHTYLVSPPSGERFVLQRLNRLFDGSTVEDLQAVTTHLRHLGWTVQRPIPADDGSLSHKDADDNVWRLLSFVEGSDAPDPMDETQLQAVGRLLARLHDDLRTMDYQPRFVLPHFHDTAHYAGELQKVAGRLPDSELGAMAQGCLSAYENLRQLPPARPQLIHGDPRTTNVLFRDGRPLCYIDFDTLMVASPWIDIGDLLRSISGSNDQTEARFDPARADTVIRGYREGNPGIAGSLEDCRRAALASMRLICVELAMRFLTDVVHDTYFDWDATAYASRRDNNIARARAQWQTYLQSL